MSIVDKTLKMIQTKDILVDLYTDSYDESFYGFIKKQNDEFLLLEHYNNDGFYNGILIFKRKDITRLKWDNNYTNSAFKLIERKKDISKLDKINIDSIENILKSINDIFGYISIQVQDINKDWAIIGQIQEMDSDFIVIKEFGTMSTLDRGMLMIAVSDITRIDADGIYEINLMKIHKTNN